VGRRLRGRANAAAADGLSDNARVHVREATSDDWEHVKELLAELGRPDVRNDPDEPTHRERFEQYLARDDAFALVAEHDGAVVGFGSRSSEMNCGPEVPYTPPALLPTRRSARWK
jgi:hypothetical protein